MKTVISKEINEDMLDYGELRTYVKKIKQHLLGKACKKNNSSPANSEGLVGFFLGKDPDDQGRLITDYLNFNFIEIETIHNFIQWAFPTSKRSQFNLRAPLISESFAETFQNNSLALYN